MSGTGWHLGTGLEFVDPLQVYLPKRNAKVNMANPGASFLIVITCILRVSYLL